MRIFNPFSHLVETKNYPLARFYRTTFRKKARDTFYAFYGHITPDNTGKNYQQTYNQVRLGIFDYLTLGLLFLLQHAVIQLYHHHEEAIPDTLKPLIRIPILFFLLPRVIFSAAMTVVCLPFIVIAHAISYRQHARVEREIAAYEIPNDDSEEITIYYVTGDSNLDKYKGHYVCNANKATLGLVDFEGVENQLPLNVDSKIKTRFLFEDAYPLAIATAIRDSKPESFNREDYCIKKKKADLHAITGLVDGQCLTTRLDNIDKVTITEISHEENKPLVQLAVYTREQTDSKTEFKKRHISLCRKNSTDYRFFNAMQELNVGELCEQIEKDNLTIDFQCSGRG